MGAWSTEIFGNDTACDWAWGLDDSSDLELVEATLDTVLDAEDGELFADIGEEGLAAAEALAFLIGHPARSNSYTESVENWCRRVQGEDVPAELLQKALHAVERILADDSELRDVWAETDEGESWLTEVEDLRKRLQG